MTEKNPIELILDKLNFTELEKRIFIESINDTKMDINMDKSKDVAVEKLLENMKKLSK